MKIHDKFVIELREVIKGYGNDPTVQDPCKFPCDYKFYEIEGVAICEKSFKKMKRLEDEVNEVLDKIRAEIEQAADKQFQIAMGVSDLNERYAHIQMENAYRHSLNVIDKYRTESEDKE